VLRGGKGRDQFVPAEVIGNEMEWSSLGSTKTGMNQINACCAECGEEGGGVVSLKACKSCWLVKYWSVACQRNHWSKHKKIVQTTCYRDTRRGAIQGPSGQGGLSHLLLADASKNDIMCIASIRDFIIRTHLRLCEGKR